MKKYPFYIKYLLPFIFLVIYAWSSYGQLNIGEWRAHLSYYTVKSITGSETEIYAATNAGVQIYHKNENSLETLTPNKELNDVGINIIEYIDETETLFIGYSNGNIDILENNGIINLPGIKQGGFQESKKINDLIFVDGMVLIACDFGIVEYNPSSRQFKETYYIEEGSVINIFDLEIDEEKIYAATEQGVYYANRSGNFLNPTTWNRITTLSNYTQSFNKVEAINGNLIVNLNSQSGDDIVYSIDNSNNSRILISNEGVIEDLIVDNAALYIALSEKIKIYNSSLNLSETINEYSFGFSRPLDLYIDQQELWIGDLQYGMVRSSGTGQFESIIRNGPRSDQVFEIEASSEHVYVARGGYNNSLNGYDVPAMFYHFSENTWNNYNSEVYRDFSDILIDRKNPSHIYIGSWNDGLIEFSDMEFDVEYNSENSPLVSDGDRTKVHQLCGDDRGNVLMVNHGALNPLIIKQNNDEWHVLEYEQLQGKIIGEIIWLKNGFIWGYFKNSADMFVVDLNGTIQNLEDDRIKLFEPRDQNGKIYTNNIYTMEEDREGNIWIATDEGVGIEYEPQFIFDTDIFRPDRPRITQGDDTQYILRYNRVNDIYSDPANRKWIATENSGVILFSKDGDRLVSNFTTENSPLFSDKIYALAMEEKTGEIFFGTSEGLISYRTETAEAKADFSETYVFPNPVKPGYTGPITITGLIDGVNIKITDINGNLVYETVSEGGQALWYGKTLNGRRVSTGVYLVFITNEDGSKTHIEKILFIK